MKAMGKKIITSTFFATVLQPFSLLGPSLPASCRRGRNPLPLAAGPAMPRSIALRAASVHFLWNQPTDFARLTQYRVHRRQSS